MSSLSNTAEEHRAGVLAASTAIVHLHCGKPVTNSLAISREFGREHKNVLQSLDALIDDGTISRLEFKPTSYKDAQGKKQRMIELTERGALIAMPFIGGKNSRIGQRRLVDAFLALRDELSGAQPAEWVESRRKVSTGYQMMSEALQEVRADDGKSTKGHHFTNEAKLINWVLFGHFEAIDRDQLTQSDITLLDKLEVRNTILIARGRTYKQRKEALPAFLQSIRIKHDRLAS